MNQINEKKPNYIEIAIVSKSYNQPKREKIQKP